jgi:threonine dehydratase
MGAEQVTLADIEAARARIAGGVYYSPCVESIPLSQLTGAHVFCKLDYLQRTGSFKERGARARCCNSRPNSAGAASSRHRRAITRRASRTTRACSTRLTW